MFNSSLPSLFLRSLVIVALEEVQSFSADSFFFQLLSTTCSSLHGTKSRFSLGSGSRWCRSWGRGLRLGGRLGGRRRFRCRGRGRCRFNRSRWCRRGRLNLLLDGSRGWGLLL